MVGSTALPHAHGVARDLPISLVGAQYDIFRVVHIDLVWEAARFETERAVFLIGHTALARHAFKTIAGVEHQPAFGGGDNELTSAARMINSRDTPHFRQLGDRRGGAQHITMVDTAARQRDLLVVAGIETRSEKRSRAEVEGGI